MNNSKAFVPKRNRIKDRGIVSTVLLYFFAALIAFITIYPMYYVLVLSFSSPREALTMTGSGSASLWTATSAYLPTATCG